MVLPDWVLGRWSHVSLVEFQLSKMDEELINNGMLQVVLTQEVITRKKVHSFVPSRPYITAAVAPMPRNLAWSSQLTPNNLDFMVSH